MNHVRNLVLGLSAALLGVLMMFGPAKAATNSCINVESCGGATLALMTHGPLSLAVLGHDTLVNGGFGYNNEKVGFTTSGATDGTQDFTLAKDNSAVHDPYGNGEYVLEFTPGGNQPPAGDLQYCVSVEDTYPTVGGHVVQRWSLVLRFCGAWGGLVHPGTKNTALAPAPTNETPAYVTGADTYQLWAPVEVAGNYLQLEDIALNSSHYRHGFGGNDFVIDDRAGGPSNTWGIAYPNHFGLNQEGTATGCSQPITTFNPHDFSCPSSS